MRFLLPAILAWAIAQVLKVCVISVRKRRLDLRVLAETGGMPSSHSAIVAALTTVQWVTDSSKQGFPPPGRYLGSGVLFSMLFLAAGPLGTLAGTLLGMLGIDDVLVRLGSKLELRIQAVRLSNPLAGVDVDKAEDHALAEAILAGKA